MAKSTHKYDIKIKNISVTAGAGPVDVAPAVTELSIFESIWHPFLTAHLVMLDSHNLHHKLDNLTDIATVDIDIVKAGLDGLPQKEKLLALKPPPFHVNQTSARFMKTPKAQGYTLDLVSETYRNAIDTRVSALFTDMTISEMAKSVYNNYFVGVTDKLNKDHEHTLVCEPTDKIDSQLFSNVNLFQIMKQLKQRAVSAESGAVNYVFFETLSGHYFVSINSLIEEQDKNKLMTFAYKPSVDDSSGIGHTKKNSITVDNMQFQQQPDSQKKIQDGVYASKLVTHDIVTKQIRQYDFNIFPRWSKLNHCGDNTPTSDSEVETAGADTPRLSLAPGGTATDEKSLGSQTDSKVMYYPKHSQMYCRTATDKYDNNVENWILQRNSDIQLWNNGTQITLEVSGHTGIRVGMVIWLEVISPEATDGDKKSDSIVDKVLTGTYLITAIKHIIGGVGQSGSSSYNMIIEVTRDGSSCCVPVRNSRKEG